MESESTIAFSTFIDPPSGQHAGMTLALFGIGGWRNQLIGISSIHLLKTFINAEHLSHHVIMWQVLIHVTFLVSALVVSATDRLLY